MNKTSRLGDRKDYIANLVRFSLDYTEMLTMPRKIQVTFTNEQWKLLEKLRGTMGDADSEIVRNIVIAYLSEKSYIKEEAFNK
ncbi:MAG: hypothetical protein QXV01_09165 [Candidatus Bathyarchaeia archaeon]